MDDVRKPVKVGGGYALGRNGAIAALSSSAWTRVRDRDTGVR
jgi:hypothetical protein